MALTPSCDTDPLFCLGIITQLKTHVPFAIRIYLKYNALLQKPSHQYAELDFYTSLTYTTRRKHPWTKLTFCATIDVMSSHLDITTINDDYI